MSAGQQPNNAVSNPSSVQAQASNRAVPAAVNSWSAEYLDDQYRRFKADPASVTPDVAAFFQGFDLALARPAGVDAGAGGGSTIQSRADDLFAAYRALGHLIAKIDPFGRERARPAALTLKYFGLTDADLDRQVRLDLLPGGAGTLQQAIDALRAIYCGSIGVEFMHIPDDAERAWWRKKFEGGEAAAALSKGDQVRTLEYLTAVEKFEFFLGKRFQGKKRFSLEGGDALLPLLKFLTERAGELGTQEIILGMAHRGRLSVLKTYLGKDLGRLFTEFKDSWVEGTNQGSNSGGVGGGVGGGGGGGGGDVKYHRGYSGDQSLPGGGVVHLSMLNNPSHLESVNPVVMGRCRAKQDLAGDAERRRVVSLLIHGDAAIAGQGIVTECLNMSRLPGYDVGGTLHVVINNLVGFTTDPEDGRSTEYCTDVAKMINAPVLHVNGDDPEAVVRAAWMAAQYRHEFRKDVFVDLVCFRRYGHNEQDEPTYTQPALYALVKGHPGPAETYRTRLVEAGVISRAQADAMVEREIAALDEAYEIAVKHPVDPVPPPGGGLWKGLGGAYSFDAPRTAVEAKRIAEVSTALGRVPDGFNVNAKLKGLLQNRASLPTTNKIAHADAELLAIGTLLLDGIPTRLSGQDCRRGTFTQRHAVLRDEKTGERYTPVNHITPDQKARFSVWDSPLSEYAVMGFDYGYSRANPRTLVMWEGQFGDFVNGAQIILDQYLASSEVKWNRWAGLTLLLPHGYEGQGPEHSSARLERFLQLCADDNMEVVYPSTAAQTFHMLRRQALRDFRKPLIVMTPKKYLRVETSTVQDLSTGTFQHIIDDAAVPAAAAKGVARVLYCSGKLFHELNERRNAAGRQDVAIVRVEQLYPLNVKALREIDARYPKAARRIWVQEEPRNQGAYLFIADRFREDLGIELGYIGRAACSSPATGSERAHNEQQQRILAEAVAPAPPAPPLPPPAPTGDAKSGSAAANGASQPAAKAKR